MAINLIDYDVLAKGQQVYATKAQDLNQILSDLVKMNADLSNGWQNETARAFVERFDTDHKKAMNSLVAALEEISTYIRDYASSHQEDDSNSASRIR